LTCALLDALTRSSVDIEKLCRREIEKLCRRDIEKLCRREIEKQQLHVTVTVTCCVNLEKLWKSSAAEILKSSAAEKSKTSAAEILKSSAAEKIKKSNSYMLPLLVVSTWKS
jgi:hypothetical protein